MVKKEEEEGIEMREGKEEGWSGVEGGEGERR